MSEKQKRLLMLTPEEFHAWLQYLYHVPETEALITSIRESPSVKKVSGYANNVTGHYPSPKIGCLIQFESQHIMKFDSKTDSNHNIQL